MKKEELKKILKPLIKECIKEVVFEDGVISGLVSEVVQGLGRPIIHESTVNKEKSSDFTRSRVELQKESQRSMEQAKQKLEQSMGASAFGGIFENVDPIPPGGESPTKASDGQGPLSSYASNDPGVDITGLMNMGGKQWKNMI